MYEDLSQLKEKNINVEGEEYYAVLGGYINKISDLEGGKTSDITSLLKRASSGESELENEFAGLTKNENVGAILSSPISREKKIFLLHEEAVAIGSQRVYQETFSKCRKFGDINERIDAIKHRYGRNYEDYKMLMNIKNDEKELTKLIQMRAGNVSTPVEEIKKVVLSNIEAQEAEFIKQQTNYVNKVVSFLVDDECRLVIEQESLQIS